MKKNQFLCYDTYDLFCVLKLSLLYSWRQQWKGYCPGDMLFRRNHRRPDLAATMCGGTEPGGRRASVQHRGTVLAPFLFTLYTSDFTYSPSTCHPQNLCDDSVTLSLITDRVDKEYRGPMQIFVDRCLQNQGAVDILQEVTTCSTCSDEHPGYGHWEGVHLQVRGCTSEQ